MKVRSAKALLVLFVLGLALNTLTAGENLWVYTTGTDTRPQGSWELKLSNVT
ncbi:MAG: hypothetical protein HRT88_03330, partial [Lentisphaeraceae bacterium]|nr:hypothetical protein [Lentisphaeraceae bacterium]